MSRIDTSTQLRNLPRRTAPAELTTKLRVMASTERQRAKRPRGLRGLAAVCIGYAQLPLNNVMRPMALPVFGGVFAAVILFSMFLPPVYPLRSASTVDIPTMLTTTAIVKGTAPVGVADSDVIVDVTVGENGRMVDYTIVSGPSSAHDSEWKRRLENALIFTEFTPATAFGQPTSTKKRLILDASSVEVRG